MDDHPLAPLVTVAEVAAILGVSKMTVYRMTHAGELAAVKVDGKWRIPWAALCQIPGADEAQEIQRSLNADRRDPSSGE